MYVLRKSIGEKTIGNAEQKAKNLILDAENRAETLKKRRYWKPKKRYTGRETMPKGRSGRGGTRYRSPRGDSFRKKKR